MKELFNMVWIELRKAIRSRMPLFTVVGSLLMPLGIAFLIFAAKNPDITRKLGLISAKANLMAYAATNWSSYLGLYAQIMGTAGIILFTLITSWVFGREFADGTLKDMLAVPVQRSSIVLAKFIVVAIWSLVSAAIILIAGLVMGAIIQLSQGSINIILMGSALTMITACMAIVVILPFAFFASVGRGYLLPIGVMLLVFIMANLVNVAGWGDYFPWAVPGLFAQGKESLAAISFWIVLFTGLIGMLGTYLWWKFADQNR
jgi:ABC-2 type transport system permease protein